MPTWLNLIDLQARCSSWTDFLMVPSLPSVSRWDLQFNVKYTWCYTLCIVQVIAFAERDQEDRLDPMIYIFPRMTKCTFHKFGTSGEVEKHDALCILPLNIVNEKIYIFLWFWLLLLGCLSTLVVAYRLGQLFLTKPVFQDWLNNSVWDHGAKSRMDSNWVEIKNFWARPC